MKQTGRLAGLCLLLLLSSLPGCGKKGPLYLPVDKLPKSPPAVVENENTTSESDQRKKPDTPTTTTDTANETP